jgi:hypothetical protein
MKKFIVLFAAAGLSIASAKTYTVLLDRPAMAGNVQLKPGHYKVNVEGTTATLADVKKAKDVEATGQVASADRKFPETTLQFSQDNNGQSRVHEIDLGGTTTKVQFNQ